MGGSGVREMRSDKVAAEEKINIKKLLKPSTIL
jgi:hypothetical protein